MKNNSNSTGGGIGFIGLLTIAFIVLKLCDVIQWPWVWVVSPIWISAALIVLTIFIVYIVNIIKFRIIKRNQKRIEREFIDK